VPSYERLVVLIPTFDPPATALAQLDRLDAEWSFGSVARGAEKIIIDIDYR